MKTARHIALAAAVAATTACPAGELFCELGGGDPYGEMPDLDMLVGDTVETEVWKHFTSPACQEVAYRYRAEYMASSADTAAVAVSTTDSLLVTVALDVADSVRVAVWATSDGWGTEWPTENTRYSHDFHVWVRPRLAGR